MSSKIGLAASIKLLFLDEKAFSEACLPKMLAKARGTHRLFSWSLREFPKKWAFLDKLLVFLEPKFKDDVEKFYDNEGPSMKDIFNDNQLDRLDSMLAEHLQKKLTVLRR